MDLRTSTKEKAVQKRKSFATLDEDKNLKIQYEEADGNFCLISFTGVGHAMGGIDVQNPEFSKSDIQGPRLYITDKKRSWGNNLNLDKILKLIEPFAEGRTVVSLGNSLGGFLAILLSEKLNAKITVAFAPQWSVHKKIVPNERRWQEYIRKIWWFKYKDLSKRFAKNCNYYIFFGDDKHENLHSKFFPHTQENVTIFKIVDTGHNVARFLKDNNCLYDIINNCLINENVTHILESKNIAFRKNEE